MTSSAVQEVLGIIKKWTPANSSNKEDEDQPAEIFDKHPISAMTSVDIDTCPQSEMLLITDSWKTEWHKDGVQVAVNSLTDMPKSTVEQIHVKQPQRTSSFSIPKKLIRVTKNARYDRDIHQLIPVESFLDNGILYQVDELDYSWIKTVNEERDCLGEVPINDWMLERCIDVTERLCHQKMQKKARETEGIGLEFDENSKCDVCQSTEGEDENELVFCDNCYVCVHQACYGIMEIPSGAWICRMCQHNVKSTTSCVLCTNTGGAMKKTNIEDQWCHVSCALWVPEVGFGDPDLMEPIIDTEKIPQARWNLVCSLCKLRTGAAIQCCLKSCKVAFHVTCAFQAGLVMKQVLTADDVKLLSYCSKHGRRDSTSTKSPMKQVGHKGRITSSSNADNKDIADSQSTETLRMEMLAELTENFHEYVTCKDLTSTLKRIGVKIPTDIVTKIFSYWKLKRKINMNRPFIQVLEDESYLEQERQSNRANKEVLDSFCKVRFGLDRARLVIDMVLKREKKKFFLLQRMSQIGERQCRALLTNKAVANVTDEDLAFLKTIHLGDTVYDNPNLRVTPPVTPRADGKRAAVEVLDPVQSPTVKRRMQGPKCARIKRRQKENTDTSGRVVMDPLLAMLNPVDLIPRDQLLVPEDIKQRLRSGLARVEFSHLIRSIGDQSATCVEPVDSSDDPMVEGGVPEYADCVVTGSSIVEPAEDSSVTLPRRFANVFDVVSRIFK